MLNIEKKKFAIRSAHRPQEGYALSGVVKVADTDGKGFAYIKFAEALVVAVGNALPYGVSTDHPCYLSVLHLHKLDKWRVLAYYLDGSKGVLLWEANERPEWLKRVRRG